MCIRDRVETNYFFDNWFFSVGGGAQVLFGDQTDLGKVKKRIAPALQDVYKRQTIGKAESYLP